MTVFVKTFALVALALVINEITVIAIRSKTSMRTLYKGPVKPPAPGEEFDMRHWLQSAMPKREERCTGTSKEKDVARCLEPLGMEDGRIPDESITASSIYDNNALLCGPQRARPHTTGSIAAWCARDDDVAPWIQVDFNSQVYITGLITQGRGDKDDWVTRYYVKYSDDGDSWYNVTYANGTTVEFVGNVDRNSLVTAHIVATLHTRFLRILPTAWHRYCRLRFEVLGCQQ